jgi:tRNA nucleotidyltransferase (CCA-adding enzyme)
MGVRGYGSTEAEAFEQAAVALTALVADVDAVNDRERVSLECEAPDHELLLAEWLNGLVFELSTRRMLFRRFHVTIEDDRLHGRAWGEAVDRERHRPAVEVKGATYTALRVACEDGRWVAQTVVDV